MTDSKEIENPPGLTELRYRAGRHGSTLAALERATGSDAFPGLGPLTTRDRSDWTLAYLDAAASLVHVVSFHGERIANESYLATAVERFSLRQLARLVDHELSPGKSAEVYVQFELDDRPDVPAEVPLPAGIAINSVPGPGEDPQRYETTTDFMARRVWSELRPRQTQPVKAASAATAASTVFEGVGFRVAAGDLLAFTTSTGHHVIRVVTGVSVNTSAGRTAVAHATLDPVPTAVEPVAPYLSILMARLGDVAHTAVTIPGIVDTAWVDGTIVDTARVDGTVEEHSFHLADLARPVRTAHVGMQILAHLAGRRPRPEPAVGLFRTRAGLFGLKGMAATDTAALVSSQAEVVSRNTLWLPLDNVYDGVGPGSLIAVLNSTRAPMVFTVEATDQVTKTGSGYSATVTRVLIDAGSDHAALAGLELRATSVALRTDPLVLADAIIADDVTGTIIDLAVLDLDLVEGQAVSIAGERTDLPGVVHTVIRRIKDLHVVDGRTVLTLEAPIAHPLRRSSVVVNANVVEASHGRTVQGVLGSGDGTATFQTFVLPDSPLTHVVASTTTGVTPALLIRVDGIEWNLVRCLVVAGPDDRVYELRNQEDGTTLVRFGDGRTGARLPSGAENIVATYRVGIGTGGLVTAGQLRLLSHKPLGIKGVTNPVASFDAADGDTIDDARVAAPAAVMTLDRVVSLRDHEDFAQTFLGIAKASATWVWDGRRRAVVVTAAGSGGVTFDAEDPTLERLRDALHSAGDGATPVTVVGHRTVPFLVAGSVAVDPAYDTDTVVAAVESAVRDRYKFDRMRLGGFVARSEVIAVMQAVAGVAHVNLDLLDRADKETPGNHAMLRADAPIAGSRTSNLTELAGAELLVIDDRPLPIGVMP